MREKNTHLTDKGLCGKCAIVTGGGRGIGRCIAETLAQKGVRVLLVSRTSAELKDAVQSIRAAGGTGDILTGDVGSPNTAERATRRCIEVFRGLDILVNAAGVIGPMGPIETNDTRHWRKTIEINLDGTFHFIRAVLPRMKKQRSGSIINLSGGGASAPRPMFCAYAVSKVAVVRLTETVADEVKGFNIRVNAIAPGAVNTRMFEDMLKAGRKVGAAEYRQIREQIKSGGVSPQRAADLAVFLASDHSNDVNGRLISAVWDKWQSWTADDIHNIRGSDIYTIRRISTQKKA